MEILVIFEGGTDLESPKKGRRPIKTREFETGRAELPFEHN